VDNLNIKVSIIMSVFNDENNIKNSILSILNQTYKNIELLVLDDCSTDNTFNVINSITDPRLKIFQNKENLGLTKSLNILINKTTGLLIARQDSDDISLKQRIETQVRFMQKNNLDACTTRAYRKDSKKSIPRFSHLFPNKLVMKYKNPFIHGTLMIYKSTIELVGLYDENYKYAQDYKLFVDLYKNNLKIKTLNKRLYVLNMDQNISTLHNSEQRKAFTKIRGLI